MRRPDSSSERYYTLVCCKFFQGINISMLFGSQKCFSILIIIYNICVTFETSFCAWLRVVLFSCPFLILEIPLRATLCCSFPEFVMSMVLDHVLYNVVVQVCLSLGMQLLLAVGFSENENLSFDQVEDQSRTNSCCANAVCGAFEYMGKRKAMESGPKRSGLLWHSLLLTWPPKGPFWIFQKPWPGGLRWKALDRT